jgi:3-phenylpropionate/cinnamic acid dioxygenase small subunit
MSSLASLADLADRQAIADLISRLARWLDEQRFEETAALFTDDVSVSTPGGTSAGIEAVADQARRNHADHRTQHVIANVLVDLDLDGDGDGDGDRATVGANLVATFVTDTAQPSPSYTAGQRYRFDAVRTPGGWRLSRIEVRPVWSVGERPVPAAA